MYVIANKPKVNTLFIIMGCLLLYIGISLDKLMADDSTIKTDNNKLSYVTLDDGTTLDIYKRYDAKGNELFLKEYTTTKVNGSLKFKKNLNKSYEHILNYQGNISEDEAYYVKQLALFMFLTNDYFESATSNPTYILTEARALAYEAHEKKKEINLFNTSYFERVGDFVHHNENNQFEYMGYIFHGHIESLTLWSPTGTKVYNWYGQLNDLRYDYDKFTFRPETTSSVADLRTEFTFRQQSVYQGNSGGIDFIGIQPKASIQLQDTIMIYATQNDTDGTYKQASLVDANSNEKLKGPENFYIVRDTKGRTMIPNEHGKVALMDVPSVELIAYPSNYNPQKTATNHNCTVNHNNNSSFELNGEHVIHVEDIINFKIYYHDTLNNDYMSGKFALYKRDGTLIDTKSTDRYGATFNRIPEGSYLIQQMDDDHPVKYKDKTPIMVTTENSPFRVEYTPPEINIEVKVQEKDGTPVANSEIILSPSNERKTTNSSGIVTFVEQPGRYRLQCMPVLGYTVENEYTDIFEITHFDQNGSTVKKTFTVERTTKNIEITSLDDSGNPIPNVTYQIEPSSKIITTDSEGKASVSLPWGDYTFKKTSIASKYDILESEFTISTNPRSPAKVTKTSTDKIKKGSVLITNKSLLDNTPIVGSKFGIFNEQNQKIQEGTTAQNGTVTFTNIPYGPYKVREINTVNGYKPNPSEHSIFINKDGMTATVNTFNDIATSTINISAVDDEDGEPVSNIMIGLYQNDGSTLIDSSYTSDTGTVEFTDIPVGNYKVKQISNPNEYLTNTSIVEVQITDTTPKSAEFRYTPVKGTITINTTDSENTDKIPNVDIEITPVNSKETDTLNLNTGATGSVQTKQLRYGDYNIVVTTISNNYHENTSVYPVSITSNGEDVVVNIPNNPVKFRLQVRMKDKETINPLKGAQFEILQNGVPITNGGQTVFTTNKNGEIILTEELRAGTYTLVEKQTSVGYIGVAPTEFTIDRNSALTHGYHIIELDNTVIKGSVELHLKEDGTNNPIQNATLELWGKPNTVNMFTLDRFDTDTLISTHNTDSSGKFIINDLPYGSYYFKIRTLPNQYGPKTDVIEFNITSTGKEIVEHTISQVNGNITINVKDLETNELIPNVTVEVNGESHTLEQGTTKITKPYGDYNIITTKVPDNYNLDSSPKVANVRIDGDEIEVDILQSKKKSDIVIKVKDNYGANVPSSQITINDATYQVNNGSLFLDDMLYGTYTITQTRVSNGYVLNNTPVELQVENHGHTYNAEIVNTKIEGDIKISVKDAKTNEPVNGAIISLDGDRKEVTNGEITIPKVSYGSHRITQISAPEGYKISQEVKTINIRNNGETQEITLLNEPIQASITINVIDSETKHKVASKIEVNGEEHVLTNGSLTLEDVSYGNYGIIQTDTSEGYVLNQNTFSINVDGTSEDYNIDIPNDIIKGNVNLSIVDSITQEPIPNATVKLDDSKDIITVNNGNVLIENVRYGEHTFTQLSTDPKYMVNSDIIKFTITDNSTQNVTIPNEKINGNIEIQVKDSNTGELLNDFELDINGELYTSTTGIISLNNLDNGTYNIKQTKTTEGYNVSKNPITVTISNSEKQSVEIKNDIIKAKVLIRSVDTNTKAPLSNVEFDIINSESKEVVTSIKTDNRGRVELELPYGSYEIKETKPHQNYLPNPTTTSLDIVSSADNIKKVIESSKNSASGGVGSPNTGTVHFRIGLGITIILTTTWLIFYRTRRK